MHPRPMLLILLFLSGPLLANQAGIVQIVRGEVIATDTQGTQRPLASNLPVYEGDRLTTGPKGRLILRMADGGKLHLGSDTQLFVQHYRQPEQPQPGAAMELLRGALRMVSGALGKQPDPRFELRTRVATIGIRGTDFWAGMGYFQAGKLELALIEGKGVYLRNPAGETHLTQAGTGTGTADLNTPPTPAKKWPEEKLRKALQSVALD